MAYPTSTPATATAGSNARPKPGAAKPTTAAATGPTPRSASGKSAASQTAAGAPQPPGQGKNKLWSTNPPEERARIKQFWLSLSEYERRSLVQVSCILLLGFKLMSVSVIG